MKNKNNEVNAPEQEKQYGTTDRPLEKDVVTYPEGMEEVNTYQLLDHSSLPFSTYISTDWEYQVYGNDSLPLNGVQISPASGNGGQIEIGFFPKESSHEEVEQFFDEIITLHEEMSGVEPYQQHEEDRQEWTIQTYIDGMQVGETSVKLVTLGESNDRYFYIVNEHPYEWGDGWVVIEELLYLE